MSSTVNSRVQSPLPRTAQPLTFWGRVGKFAPKIAASAGLITVGALGNQIYNNGFVRTAKGIYQGTKNTVTGIVRGTKEIGKGFVNGYQAFKSAFVPMDAQGTERQNPEDQTQKGKIEEDIHQRSYTQKNLGQRIY